MRRVIFMVRDKLAGSFEVFGVWPHSTIAIRAFKDAMANPKSVISLHPEDYDLYESTFFKTDTGVMGSSSRAAEPVLLRRGGAPDEDCV